MTLPPRGVGPFWFYSEGQGEEFSDRDEVILVELARSPEGGVWRLPQFDIEVCERDAPRGFVQATRQLIALGRALREVPDHYVTEVEKRQRYLIENVFVPWLVDVFGDDELTDQIANRQDLKPLLVG